MKKCVICILLALMITLSIAQASGFANEPEPTDFLRYNVLLLDASGSMEGETLEVIKKSAINFCREVLEASGSNYVAVVSFSNNAKTEKFSFFIYFIEKYHKYSVNRNILEHNTRQ